MAFVNAFPFRNLPQYSQTGRKEIPQINCLCFSDSLDCLPADLITKWIEKNYCSSFSPIGLRAEFFQLLVRVAASDRYSICDNWKFLSQSFELTGLGWRFL